MGNLFRCGGESQSYSTGKPRIEGTTTAYGDGDWVSNLSSTLNLILLKTDKIVDLDISCTTKGSGISGDAPKCTITIDGINVETFPVGKNSNPIHKQYNLLNNTNIQIYMAPNAIGGDHYFTFNFKIW